MNGKHFRTDLDAELESRTDWDRLRALTDDQLEAAIDADPDSFAHSEFEQVGRSGASAHYLVYRDRTGQFRWRLRAANGEILAMSPEGYVSRQDVEDAITQLRDVMLGARSKAA